MNIPDPASEPWHLDKRIPIALLCAVLGQTAALAWWASGITTRLFVLEQSQSEEHGRVENMRENTAELSSNLATITERTGTLIKITDQINAKVDQLRDARGEPLK